MDDREIITYQIDTLKSISQSIADACKSTTQGMSENLKNLYDINGSIRHLYQQLRESEALKYELYVASRLGQPLLLRHWAIKSGPYLLHLAWNRGQSAKDARIMKDYWNDELAKKYDLMFVGYTIHNIDDIERIANSIFKEQGGYQVLENDCRIVVFRVLNIILSEKDPGVTISANGMTIVCGRDENNRTPSFPRTDVSLTKKGWFYIAFVLLIMVCVLFEILRTKGAPRIFKVSG